MTREEYECLREALDQVKGLVDLAAVQVRLSEMQADVDERQFDKALSVLLTATERACDDVIAVAEGMVDLPFQS